MRVKKGRGEVGEESRFTAWRSINRRVTLLRWTRVSIRLSLSLICRQPFKDWNVHHLVSRFWYGGGRRAHFDVCVWWCSVLISPLYSNWRTGAQMKVSSRRGSWVLRVSRFRRSLLSPRAGALLLTLLFFVVVVLMV